MGGCISRILCETEVELLERILYKISRQRYQHGLDKGRRACVDIDK
jgi:hypothetical protein